MEFRYQTFRLLSEKMDTLLVVEAVAGKTQNGNKTGGAGGGGDGGSFQYLSEMLHLVQVAVVVAVDLDFGGPEGWTSGGSGGSGIIVIDLTELINNQRIAIILNNYNLQSI